MINVIPGLTFTKIVFSLILFHKRYCIFYIVSHGILLVLMQLFFDCFYVQSVPGTFYPYRNCQNVPGWYRVNSRG
jgi:hypothetical protein